MSEPLVKWWRVRLTLRNSRNAYKTQHSQFVFHAIIKGNLPKLETPPLFTFHLAGKLGFAETISKSAVYDLEVFFYTESTAEAFAGLGPRLVLENFDLLHLGPPEARSIDDLIAESPAPAWQNEELVLIFRTPFYHAKKQKKALHGLLTPEVFLDNLHRRIDFLSQGKCNPLEAAVPDLALIPWYLDFRSHHHQSGSQPGNCMRVVGDVGPLFLRGNWQPLWQWLLLCSELHIGKQTPFGQGRYTIAQGTDYFDPLLAESSRYQKVWARLADTSDIPPGTDASWRQDATLPLQLAENVRTGNYHPTPVPEIIITKAGSTGVRSIALVPPEDKIIHRLLHEMLSARLDAVLADSSVGYRAGRSVETARRLIAAAMRDGCSHIVHADIESFFDDIQWPALETRLDGLLPQGDTLLRTILGRIIRTPLLQEGSRIERQRGLLQGSPLSPLLANLYLHDFDTQLIALGHRVVRYGDDFILLSQSPEQAEMALQDATRLLIPLGLSLQKEKTALLETAAGFRFLGKQMGGDHMDEECVETRVLKQTLYLHTEHTWAGLEHGTFVIRDGKKLVARVPIERVGEVVLLGAGGVSSKLIAKCMERRIPMAFASGPGHLHAVIAPPTKHAHDIAHRHALRHAALGEKELATFAGELVAAKLAGYRAWLQTLPRPETKSLDRKILAAIEAARMAHTVGQALGIEGHAASLLFPFVHSRLRVAGFSCRGRAPRERRDGYNILLDYGYFLLFTRINLLLRLRGLNPWLGFLHSAQNTYESLVCDLQEPFRVRVDRLVLRVINTQVIQPDDFLPVEGGQLKLRHEASRLFLHHFERELDTCLMGEPGTLRELIAQQVFDIKAWVAGDREVRFYHRKCRSEKWKK